MTNELLATVARGSEAGSKHTLGLFLVRLGVILRAIYQTTMAAAARQTKHHL